ncbi:Reverse transcriptase domain-containing protein [Aphis craccivora]|uniref:Reverse transcriptase domain-containing protein n=1 Tax=Aphis craccivora TaxID=307492 RepID=A0A6G0Z9T8_APHCR|nr:Reverse transcriptase domain-containing protein [Aphis craccivora]
MRFETKIQQNIYDVLRFNRETNTYDERRRNNELQKLYDRSNIIAFIRNKLLEWFGHTWRIDGQLIKKLMRKINKIKDPQTTGRLRPWWFHVITRNNKDRDRPEYNI